LATPRAHNLVGLRLVAGDGVQALLDQFLDQLGALTRLVSETNEDFDLLSWWPTRSTYEAGCLNIRLHPQKMRAIDVPPGDRKGHILA